MHFIETDSIKLKAIKIPDLDAIGSASQDKIKKIIGDIESGKGYEPIKVLHDPDHNIYIVKEGLETFMACWMLNYEWIKAEIKL